ncbi:thioesterase family protein [Nocardia brevicatena]|uniref:thioesterase family protein n=1 Tax=Nocardia brevicatena TaxID=37327 RepID=UPI0009FFEC71|nr:thioesterase family protein [Nocardia brevicatena]
MTTELSPDIDVVSPDAPFGRVCTLTELAAAEPGVGRYRGFIDDIWTIGSKVHGGTMVATSAAAATRWLRTVEPDRADMGPIAASADFLGAPEPGEVDFEVNIRKVGRQICLADVELIQRDRSLVRTAFTFGRLDDAQAPPQYAPEHTDLPVEPGPDAIGYEPGSSMGRIVHVARGMELYLDREWAPFIDAEQGVPRMRMWVRPRAGDQAAPDIAAYLAMMVADISPPVPMNLGHFGWAPTVQMTTYLRRRPAPGWLRVIATAHEIGGRMFDCDQIVLDSTGALVAQSRQLAFLPSS